MERGEIQWIKINTIFFDPRNPLYLNVAKWIVFVTSALIILIGFVALNNIPENGFFVMISGVVYYFSGMVFVNMLYNIRDIKLNTQRTNKLLEKQINSNDSIW